MADHDWPFESAVHVFALATLLLAAVAPTAAILIARPWMRRPASGWKLACFGLAAAIFLLVAAAALPLLFARASDTRTSRAFVVNATLEGFLRALGPAWWLAPSAYVLVGLAVALVVGGALRVPSLDYSTLPPSGVRKVVARGLPLELLNDHPDKGSPAFVRAAALGSADAQAARLQQRVMLHYRGVGQLGRDAVLLRVRRLHEVVRSAEDPAATRAPLREMQEIAATLDSGVSLPALARRWRHEAPRSGT
ncbi:hypothetical protein ACTU3I_11220 [Microbacterium sp. RD1]|uniref:hypothetical protein n=1 Tax=Microbacterium sp. RD1 TaxID=3457313 RepID=UPI003FA52E84